PFVGDVASVTFDGGATWRNVPIPVSQAEGGPYGFAGNAWASFAPNGDLYASSISVVVNKSTDGGLTWSQPIQVATDQKIRKSTTRLPFPPIRPTLPIRQNLSTWTRPGLASISRSATPTPRRRCSPARRTAGRLGNRPGTSTMPPAATSTGG